MDGLKHRKL